MPLTAADGRPKESGTFRLMERLMLRARILRLLNRKIILSSFLFGLTFPILGFFLQVVGKRLLLGGGSPPTLRFIVGGVILFFFTGTLFSFGFHLIALFLPGRRMRAKAFWYSILIGTGIYLGNIVNFVAFDPAGGADPFSQYKITQALTAACDAANFLINGWLLGWVASRMEPAGDPPSSREKFLVWPSLAGLILFPVVGIAAWTIWTPVFGVGYLVPATRELWFQAVFWIPLALTCGVAVPLLYQVAEPLLSGRWWKKAGGFTLLHFLLYWVTLTLFIIPVGGMAWRDAFFFFAVALPALFAVSLPAAWGMRKDP
jgi:hypothetical protein